MCPWPSSSTCSAASPWARLSRAPSTTSESDFHDSIGLRMDGPFSRPTRFNAQDRRGSPRFRDASMSARAVLSDPAGVSDPLASCEDLLVPSKYSTLSASGLSCHEAQSLPCVTARTPLCLRFAHVVTSMSPMLDSKWGGSFRLPGRELAPAESARFSLAHRSHLARSASTISVCPSWMA